MASSRTALALALALLVLAPMLPQAPAASAATTGRLVLGVDDASVAASLPGATLLRWSAPLRAAVVLAQDPGATLAAALADPRVRYAELDPARALLLATPNDPQYASQHAPAQVNLDDAWDTTTGDLDAAVCIVDSGARLSHVDLAPTRLRGKRNVVDDNDDVQDATGHGTHVLGIAAASVGNGQAIAGAGNVGYYVAKVGGDEAFFSDVAEGVQWCSDRPDARIVINLSLGCAAASLSPLHGSGEECYSQMLADAIANAQADGRLVVAAAGNDGPCYSCVAFPARLSGVLAVGCTRAQETLCSFSSTGPQVGLAAPGEGILSLSNSSDTGVEEMDGTSMAAPLVAGAAALYWSHDTSITASALHARLLNAGQPLGAAGHDASFGCGELDVQRLFDGVGSCTMSAAPACDTNPANDCRANAEPLTQRSGTITFSNANAQDEANETHPCDGGKTVWFRFTAYRNGTASISGRAGSAEGIVSVWETTPGASTRFIGCHEVIAPLFFFDFPCVQGRTYEIQVGTHFGHAGSVGFEHHLCHVAPAPPEAPRNLTAQPGGTRGAVALAWDAPAWDGADPIVAYTVSRGDAACAGMTLVATLPAEARAHEDVAPEGVAHCYRVLATNGLGAGANATAIGAPRGIPVAPASLSATGGASRISLSWQPPSRSTGDPVLGFAVEGADAATGPWTRLADLDASARQFNETALPPGQTRHYRVLATNVHGEGTATAPRAATTFARPGPPTQLAAGPGPGAGEVRVRWQPPLDTGGPGITGYRVYEDGLLLGSVDASARSYTRSGLGEGETRQYSVAAMNILGEGEPASAVAGTTMTRPDPPQNVTAETTITVAVTIRFDAPSWNGGGNVTHYSVHRASAPDGPFVHLGNTTTGEFRDSGAPLLSASYYHVRAVNPAGASAPSATACGHPHPAGRILDGC